MVSSNARRNMGCTFLPARSSLRRIPSHAAAVKNDFNGTGALITCDKEHTLTVLGHAELFCVNREPAAQIPDFFQRVDNCLKSGS